MNLATLFQFSLFCFEYLVWSFDIEGLCNHGAVLSHTVSRNLINSTTLINSVPHLFGFFAFKRKNKFLMASYFVYLLGFICLQFYWWWVSYKAYLLLSNESSKVSYLFGCCGYWELNMEKYHAMTGALTKVLPPLGHTEFIPDLEHTILLPLSLITCFYSAKAFFQSPRRKRAT